MAATAKYRDDIAGAIVTAGTSTAYTVSSFQVFDTLTDLNGQMIAFAYSAGFSKSLDTGINKGLGLPNGVYHFAFQADSPESLLELKASLEKKGVAVRGVEDHEGWCRSIYFMDPNGLQLEYCCLSRALTEDDAKPQVRFRVSREGKKLPA